MATKWTQDSIILKLKELHPNLDFSKFIFTKVDNKGIVVHSGDITFPTTPAKFKILSTTTGTQINAGKYRIIISNANGVDFETLEIQ